MCIKAVKEEQFDQQKACELIMLNVLVLNMSIMRCLAIKLNDKLLNIPIDDSEWLSLIV